MGRFRRITTALGVLAALSALTTALAAGPTAPGAGAHDAATLSSAPGAGETLQESLARLVAQTSGDSCLVVAVDGDVVFSHDPSRPLIPASNQKLVTALAVHDLVGSQSTYQTRFLSTDPNLADGVLDGDLYMVGGGDPVIKTDGYASRKRHQPQVYTSMQGVADRLAAAGITRITGNVVGDESRYDSQRVVATWKPSYVTDNEAGPLSALGMDDGFDTQPDGTEVRATDPPASTATMLGRMLIDRGVAVDGGATSGVAPPSALEVARIASPPAGAVIGQILRTSDNTVSELQLKEVDTVDGDQGSTAGGATAATEAMADRGLPLAGVHVVDGSGLDRNNRLTCGLLVALLESAGVGSVIDQGLSVSARTGTLRSTWVNTRAEGRIRAKTGSLDGVKALSGLVAGREGQNVTFAYLQNNYAGSFSALARRAELGEVLSLHADAGTLRGGRPSGDEPVLPARDIEQACPPDRIGDPAFGDVPASFTHHRAIACVVHWSVAQGRSPSSYAPLAAVTRAQMATFIANTIEAAGAILPPGPIDAFDDDTSSVHHDNINRLAAAGVVSGTGPRTYEPDLPVSRAQMATFLVKAHGFITDTALPSTIDPFRDDESGAGGFHEHNINAVAQIGITTGVANWTYAPDDPVSRGQMASFLARVLDLLVQDEGVVVP